MKPDFSEFSYGYAATEELIHQHPGSLVAAPAFPSLIEEGQSGGYDVKIPLRGIPIFLQFKLSDYLERTSAKENRDGVLSVPYYRMHLRATRYSAQHNLLMNLEAKGEAVFYMAPQFHLPEELNMHYLNKNVIENSIAFSPMDIGPLPTDGPHYVVFRSHMGYGFRCSEDPVEVREVGLKEGLLPAMKERGVASRALGTKGFRAIAENMLDSLEEARVRLRPHDKYLDLPGIRRIVENRSPVEAVAYMARAIFDSELIIIK